MVSMAYAELKEEWVSAVVSKIDQAGRISISAQQRKSLGLKSGSPIVISVVGNELRIRSMHAAMAELQTESGQFLQSETASVDAFITQRRSDMGEDEGLISERQEPKSIIRPDHEIEPELKAEPETVQKAEHGFKSRSER